MTTTVFAAGLVIAFVGVFGLWQETSGAAVLLESTDRWPIAGSLHRELIPVVSIRLQCSRRFFYTVCALAKYIEDTANLFNYFLASSPHV